MPLSLGILKIDRFRKGFNFLVFMHESTGLTSANFVLLYACAASKNFLMFFSLDKFLARGSILATQKPVPPGTIQMHVFVILVSMLKVQKRKPE